MRCPKCSFISFDDLAVCAKCASDLSALSKELHGTCIEARPEFFLGSAIQTPTLDEDNFSDSQMLPPIDHAGINFDDTTTGGFAPLASSRTTSSATLDLDDSIGLASEDDIAIELGDIMPIDLDQLDDTSVFAGESLVNTNSFNSGDFALGLDKTETMNVSDHHAIDLDLTGKFSSTNAHLGLGSDFSDIDIDDSSLDFDGDTEPVSGASLDGISLDSSDVSGDLTPFDDSGGINLDDELIAQLVAFNDDIDSSAGIAQNLSPAATIDPLSGSGDVIQEDSSPIDLDESLMAELTGAFPATSVVEEMSLAQGGAHAGSEESAMGSAPAAELPNEPVLDEVFLDVDLDEPVAGLVGLSVSSSSENAAVETPIEDLTGEFSPVSYTEDLGLGELGLSDIDVSGLFEASEDVSTSKDTGVLNLSMDNSDVFPDHSIPPEYISVSSADGGLTDAPIEDLTGEFLAIDTPSEEVELDDLALSEIDVSDLLASGSGDQNGLSSNDSISSGETTDADFPAEDGIAAGEINLADETAVIEQSVPPEASSAIDLDGASAQEDDSEESASSNELFDEFDISELETEFKGAAGLTTTAEEALPEIELIPDDDEGPPELPH